MHNAIQRDPVSRKSQEEQGNYNETPWDGGGFHGLATDHLDDVDFINIQPVIKASTVEDREGGGGWWLVWRRSGIPEPREEEEKKWETVYKSGASSTVSGVGALLSALAVFL